MISDLVHQLGGGGGGWGEGGLTNTNFYPTTFKVQDFTLHIAVFFGIKLFDFFLLSNFNALFFK